MWKYRLHCALPMLLAPGVVSGIMVGGVVNAVGQGMGLRGRGQISNLAVDTGYQPFSLDSMGKTACRSCPGQKGNRKCSPSCVCSRSLSSGGHWQNEGCEVSATRGWFGVSPPR